MIAPRRAERPGAPRPELEPPSAEELETCPFCEGREDRTPPETLALPADAREPDTPGWQVRVVPNLYPAFERQEVVVHTPRHTRSITEVGNEQLETIASAWRQRARAAKDAGFAYVHAVINEGREAGASLPHSHSQLIWLRGEPPLPRFERDRDECGVCALVRGEQRPVLERDELVLTCPPAGRTPYEMLVAPHRIHAGDGFREGAHLGEALALVAEGLRCLRAIEGPIPVNVWLHTAPFGEDGHWHFEIVPRLTVFAGIELGAGIYVNPLAPEEAAARLREAGQSLGG